MGQYYRIINFDKEESSGFAEWGSLDVFLFDGTPKNVVNTLTLSTPLERCLASVKYATNHSLTGHLGHLQFPNEILDIIFSEFDGLEDIACLSITNSHLLQLGIKHAEKLRRSKQWAGDRLICLGHRIKDDDLPQGLLTQKEELELHECIKEEYPNKPQYPGSLYIFVESHFKETNFASEIRYLSQEQACKYHKLDDLERKLLECIIFPSNKGTGSYALCNLSKWEYVRGEAIAELAGATMSEEGPNIGGWLGFGEVLLTQISWSSELDYWLVYRGPVHRGVWAGDRIAIIRVNEMPSATEKGKEWKDVSERVLSEVDKIWKE